MTLHMPKAHRERADGCDVGGVSILNRRKLPYTTGIIKVLTILMIHIIKHFCLGNITCFCSLAYVMTLFSIREYLR